jgi:hypothetical protein
MKAAVFTTALLFGLTAGAFLGLIIILGRPQGPIDSEIEAESIRSFH